MVRDGSKITRTGGINLEYPKKVMKKTELIELGFPEEMLLRASREKGQTFAFKMNPLAKNSPLLFDTTGFERWRLQQVKLSMMAGGCI